MITSFLHYLQYERNFSPHTVLSYGTDLKQFQAFVEKFRGDFNVKEIDFLTIRAWMLDILEQKKTPRTVNRKISALSSFFRFLIQQKIISDDPTAKIISLKTKKTLPYFFQTESVERAVESFDENDYTAVLKHLLFDFLYETGVRRSELLSIKDKDVDFSRLTIKVLGKRNKERLVPIGENLAQKIRNYITLRNREIEKKCDFLFLSQKGERIKENTLYLWVRNTMREFSTLSKCSPHVFRHTFATSLLQNGADINAVKTALGHASLAATEVYTHTTFEHIKEIYKQSHPREKNK